MGDAVVNVLVDKLTAAFTERLVEEVSLIVTFKKEFQSICEEVVHIKSLLDDPGGKTKTQSMTTWLRKLKDFLNDAMDLIDDCDNEADIRPRVCVPIFRYQMGHRIKELKKRINEINYTGSKYLTYLTSLVDMNASNSEEKRRRESGSGLPRHVHIVPSIKKEIQIITEKILEENGPPVIAVVGTAGQGKTRTAQHVFNDKEVKKRFEHRRIWLSVSRKMDIEHLLHEIAHQIQLPGDEVTVQLPGDDHAKLTIHLPKDYDQKQTVITMEGLRDRIRRHLQGERKSYLFVLDDVWHTDVLQQMGMALENQIEQINIKIVVTTCDKAVSNAIGDHTIQLKYLSDEESLQLFCFHAFPDLPGKELPPDLGSSRADILAKCTRLPIAVEEIAMLMAKARRTPTRWAEALRRLDKEAVINERVMPTLRSSYSTLPYHLQACFLYFASFPPDTPINSEHLVYAWLACFRELVFREIQGALDTAWTYIDQLIDRCIIQPSRIGGDGRVKSCVMQDFFHFLALSESNNEAKCCLQHGEDVKDFPFRPCKDASRISLVNTSISDIGGEAIECPSLRILLLCGNKKLQTIPESFFNKLKYLAVLDLSGTMIQSVPTSIGNLKRVKFLNLSDTKIKELPKSFSGLGGLQFLDIGKCKDLCRLHSGIGQHTSLLHLNVKGCEKLKRLPSGIWKLRSLRTLELKGVAFNRKAAANAFQWRYLGNLRRLSATFKGESDIFFGRQTTWSELRNLRYLSLQFDDSSSQQSPSKGQMKDPSEIVGIPEGLISLKYLEILRLSKFRVLVPRPQWLFSLHNLMVLVIHDDDSSNPDDYKGLESIINLRKLRLSSNQKCKGFPTEFGEPDAFPSLEVLIIENFSSLQNVPPLQKKAMSKLKYLEIINCSQMNDVPSGLEGLESLENLKLDDHLQESCSHQIKDKFFPSHRERRSSGKFMESKAKGKQFGSWEESVWLQGFVTPAKSYLLPSSPY